MSTALILDLALAAVLLIFILAGLKRGLFLSIMELLKDFIALIAASKLSKIFLPKATELLMPILKKRVVSIVIKLLPQDLKSLEIPQLGLDLSGLGIDQAVVSEYISKLKGSASQSLSVAGNTAYDKLAEVLETAAEQLLTTAIRSVLFFLLFIIVTIVLSVVIGIVDNAFELPIIKQFNKAGGAILGLLKGLLIVFLVFYVVKLLGITWFAEHSEGTFLLKLFINASPFNLGNFLKDNSEILSTAISKASEAVK